MKNPFFEGGYPLFDTHAHYDDARFDADRDELLSSIEKEGVGFIVDVGCSFNSIPKAFELTRKYGFMYFSVGFHPNDAASAEDYGEKRSLDMLRSYLADPKCVAIGEIGLDYHWDDVPREIQKRWFELQLQLALETGYPVIIHDREAHGDVMDILRRYKGVTGILHSFSGSPEMADELIKMGWYISFSGVLTFKNAAKLPEVAVRVPLDRMLIETDCPYLAPVPCRGRINHSGLVPFTAHALATLHGIDTAELIRLTDKNARELFCIS